TLNAVTARVLECADQQAGVPTDIGEYLPVAGLGEAIGLKHAHRITKGKAEAIIDIGNPVRNGFLPLGGSRQSEADEKYVQQAVQSGLLRLCFTNRSRS